MANYFLGTILEVLDLDTYHIKIDLPGLSKEAEAFPMRGELDEPRIGDQVLVRDVDPIYHSFYLYSKLKDDGFIGFRCRGKMVQVTEDEITVSIFDPKESYEENEGELPSTVTTYLKVLKNGSIEINTIDSEEGNLSGDFKGNVAITVKGNATIDVSGETEINSPKITLTGGTLQTGTLAGSVSPTGTGPFCAVPICPLTGAPHIGPKVTGI